MDFVLAQLKHISLFQVMAFVTVLHVVLIVLLVLMLIPAPLVFPPSPKQSIISVSAQPKITSPPKVNVYLALQDVKPALLPQTALIALVLLSFKTLSAKLTAIMDLLLWDQSVKDVLLDVFSALKTSSVSIVLIVSTCIMEPATVYVLLELLETALQETGNVFLATLHASLALIIHLSAQVVKTVKDTSKHQQSNSPAFKLVMMEHSLTTEFAQFAILPALLVWEALTTVFRALPIKFSIKEVVGLLAPPFCCQALELETLPALVTVLMDFIKFL
jgi:hypothetical protein